MAKTTFQYSNNLIFNKKTLLSLLLVLFSIGSYTYSEITATPSKPKSKQQSTFVFLKNNYSDFSNYYIVPSSYVKQNQRKKAAIVVPSEEIMDAGKITSSALARFLTLNNRNIDYNYAYKLADIYVKEAKYEGVNPDIAFTQMCLETGFLRFDGTVEKHQNNFCGLGVTGNGVKGLSFKDTEQGVRAHVQHLKAYASTKSLNRKLVDSRFKYVKRGSATHLNELTGKWATDIKYDKKIRNLLKRLYKLSSV